MSPFPTIVAVASPPGRALRGIVRLSGTGTVGLLDEHVRPRGAPVRGVRLARLQLEGGAEVPVAVLLYPGPRSYTGEDAAELQLPGNPHLLERVVDGLIASAQRRGIAARRAEPGEFTARAYLGGRIGLSEAEGVAATIAACSDSQLRAAAMLRAGRLGSIADAITADVAAALALVEAGIDFTDQEDVVAIAPSDLRRRLETLLARLDAVLDRSVGAERLDAIPWVVLTGAPNAGKSTLFNALLGRARAVVSAESGTTRDVLAEPLSIDTPAGPAEVMLVDLAGHEAPGSSTIGDRAQEAARAARERAELVLECVPATAANAGQGAAAGTRAHRGALVLITKSDLAPGAPGAPAEPGGDGGPLAVSARSGAGLQRLRAAIARRVGEAAASLAADTLALLPRHQALLRSAREHLRDAAELVSNPGEDRRHLPDPELIAAAMRAGLDRVGAISGHVSPDEVLGRIFAAFCIGK